MNLKTAAAPKSASSSPPPGKPHNPHANRETVESIVVAVILAFLFRGFIAEAFVIPTGSMAPTLQGNHKDLACSKCGFQFRAGASSENDDDGDGRFVSVSDVTCPICRYVTKIDPSNLDHSTYSGDRIVVSKFSYQISEPKRWDVIVFKFPGNAKQNYIKRLIGLPNETIRIRHGDIYVRGAGETDFKIARKPDYRQKAMLQIVDDTQYIPQMLMDAGWPTRWFPPAGDSSRWTVSDSGRRFTIATPSEEEDWLRFRYVVASEYDWERVLSGERPEELESRRGELISDYYAYNASAPMPNRSEGSNWVGDLAVECEVEIQNDSGELLVDLVEGGVHFTCHINVADGAARLSMTGGSGEFQDETGATSASPTATTSIRGAGTYHLRLSNVDDEIRFWVNDELVTFDGPTTYVPEVDVVPKWSQEDAGDLHPAGIGAKGVKLTIPRLRVLRDIYYIAALYHSTTDYEMVTDFDPTRVFAEPENWAATRLFQSRRQIEFSLDDDQFFPCGDNSPESKDARIWYDGSGIKFGNYVKRDQLTGEALMIYYPHPWYTPLRIYVPARITEPFGRWVPQGITPNFGRMGLIR